MSFVKVDIQDKICKVILNRPDKRNAFNAEMISELTEAFAKTASDQDCHVVELSAEGKSFSAGADLDWMKSMVGYTQEQNRDDSKKLREMYLALESVAAPVVGRIHGHVMGGALGLIALCDIVAAEASTQFCFSEVKLGLSPAVVSEFVMKKISRSALQPLFLTAEAFSTEKALSMGLVQFSGSLEERDDYVDDVIKKLKANGPLALRETKKLLRYIYSNENDVSGYTVDLISRLRVGPEGQEGLNAFFQRRQPDWNS